MHFIYFIEQSKHDILNSSYVTFKMILRLFYCHAIFLYCLIKSCINHFLVLNNPCQAWMKYIEQNYAYKAVHYISRNPWFIYIGYNVLSTHTHITFPLNISVWFVQLSHLIMGVLYDAHKHIMFALTFEGVALFLWVFFQTQWRYSIFLRFQTKNIQVF